MATFQQAVAKNIISLMDEMPNTEIPHASQTTRIFQKTFRESTDYKTTVSGIIQVLEKKGSFKNSMSGLGNLSKSLGGTYRRILTNEKQLQIIARDFKAKGYDVTITTHRRNACLQVHLPSPKRNHIETDALPVEVHPRLLRPYSSFIPTSHPNLAPD